MFLPTSSGRPDVERWLDAVEAELPDVSAILVIAVGALDSLQDAPADRGRRVPRDVSMIVLTPAEASAAQRAGLSLVDLPGRAMVGRAVALVLDQMAGGPAGSVELLPAVMEEHGSTAAPGRGLFGARPRRRTAG